ncbi:MAG: OmpA family protein [Endomicrobia bacterium]|nr:OmpA family protein [Endomicrobiia bacterium]
MKKLLLAVAFLMCISGVKAYAQVDVSNFYQFETSFTSNTAQIINLTSGFVFERGLSAGFGHKDIIGNGNVLGGDNSYNGLRLSSNSSVTIEGISFEKFFIKGNGSAILNIGGFVTLSSVAFSSNTAAAYVQWVNEEEEVLGGNGGAIANLGGKVVLSTATFSDNKAVIYVSTVDGNIYGGYGGAIYNSSATSVFISSHTRFESNIADLWGGAIANNLGAQFYIYDAEFILNLATGTKTTFDESERFTAGNGGAVSNSSIMTITSSTFVENSATGMGGALINYGTSSSMTLKHVVFTANEADSGGAIHNAGKIDLSSVAFNKNVARAGGAIYNTGATTDAIKTHNAEFSSNTANDGGAIYNTGKIILSSNTFLGNKAESYYISPSTTVLSGYGGAILNTGSSATFISSNTIFAFNSAEQYGGAISNGSSAIFHIYNAEFSSNRVLGAINSTGSFIAGDGGAIFNDSIMTVTSSKFLENFAYRYGGAVRNGVSGNMTLTNTIFTSNVAGMNGGAIYNTGKIILSSVTFNENEARSGGAIFNVTRGNIEMIGDITFSLNKSTPGGGGAIYLQANSTITSTAGSNIRFMYNSATTNGGAIFNLSGTVELSSALFNQNTAGFGGGAINSSGDTAKLYLGDVSFTSNTARLGGALYNNATDALLFSGKVDFTSNSARDYGGAVYNADIGSMTITGNNIFNSNTAVSGGAIYNEGIVTLLAGEFISNKANQGGAIYNTGTGAVVNIGSVQFVLNVSTNATLSAGSAIYNTDGGRVNFLAGNTVFSTHTASRGGTIFNAANSSITSESGSYAQFSYSLATTSGGAIYNSGIVTLSAGAFESNKANQGGAIYNTGAGAIINIGAVNFTLNASTSMSSAGSAIYNTNGGRVNFLAGNTVFSSHTAYQGGTIYNAANSSITSAAGSYVQISYSSATEFGGAIFNLGNIQFASVLFNENRAGDYGGAIYNASGSILSFSGEAVFTNNKVQNSGANFGGAIFTEGLMNFNGSSAIFMGNVAQSSGGAIFSNGGSRINFAANGDITFSSNSANGGGGAIWAINSIINFSADNIKFSSNSAGNRGGAIFAWDSIMSFTANTGDIIFNQNKTTNSLGIGGAIYATESTMSFTAANGNILFSSGTTDRAIHSQYSIMNFTANKIKISSNSSRDVIWAINSTMSFIANTIEFNSNIGGSAVYSSDWNLMSFNTTDGNIVFSSNNARGYGGGAIYTRQSTMNFIADNGNIIFSSNTSGTSSSGGAIFSSASVMNFSVSNGSIIFSSNIANSHGGAIYALWGSSLSFNATGRNIIFSSNTANYGNGGAIYAYQSTMSFTADKAEFSSNTALEAGAIYMNASSVTFNTQELVFKYNNSTSSNGVVYWDNNSYLDFGNTNITAIGNQANSGGFLYLEEKNVAFNGNILMENNRARNDRGGALSVANSIMSFNGSSTTFIGNVSASSGGAVFAYASTMSFAGDTMAFNSNSAKSGGAIYSSGTTVIFNGSNATFIENRATGSSGGAIDAFSSTMNFTVDNIKFDSNIAYSSGGAIAAVLSTMSFTADNIEFVSNMAELYFGGAIYANRSTMSFAADRDINFSSNSASWGGAAIYAKESIMSLTARSIKFDSNNNVYLYGWYGGAIYAKASTMSFTADDIEFISNRADDFGGAIGIENSAISFSATAGDIIFNSNFAGNTGGAITVLDSPMIFTANGDIKFNSNYAGWAGGAIYAAYNSEITFETDVEFIGNESEYGGAVYIGDGTTINAGNITFAGNTAGDKGGAVYMEGAEDSLAVMNVTPTMDVVISGNEASGIPNVFHLEQYVKLNLEIANSTMTVNDGITSNDMFTEITKTGNGLLLLDSAYNSIDGRFNIYEGLVRTGYATGTGDIYFTSGTLNITDDITMVNRIYALDSGSIIKLDIDSGTVTTIEGLIGEAGIGSFEKNGLGKIVISGSGSNIGKTDVNTGEMLVLANDFASAILTVKEPAILSGTGGIIGTVTNYGVVKPGYISQYDISFGTLTINGNYFERGNLAIRLNEGTVGDEILPTNDKLVVTGEATINPGSLIDLDMTHGFEIYKKYNVLESNGVSGIYSGLTKLFPSFDILIGKDEKDVYLYIKDVETDYVNIPGLDHNNLEIAKIIDDITAGGDADKINDISKIIGTMDPMDDAGKMRVMEEVAGSIYANALLMSGHQMRQAYHRILDRRDSGYEGYNLWAGIYGSQSKMEQDSNSGDFKARNGYLILGLEKYSDSSNFIMGYYASIGQHDTHQWEDIVDINDYRGGLYFGSFMNKWIIRAELSGGYQQYEGQRKQTLLQSRTESSYDGWNINANVEAFYRILENDSFNLSPFAGLDGSFIRISGFKEKGFDNAAAVLTVKDNQFEILNAVAGLRAEKEVGTLRWYGELGGRYNLRGSKGQFKATLNNLDNEMNIYGAGNSLLSGKAELGFSVDIWKGVELFAMGSYEKAERFYQVVGETGIGYRFGQSTKKKEQVVDNIEQIIDNSADEREAAERAANLAEEERAKHARIALLKKQIEMTKVLFDFDKSNLKPDARRATEEIAEALKELNGLDNTIQITIEGHTDEIGSHKYNEGLSKRRADTVNKKLVELGVEAEMLEKQWYGKTRPTATNATKEGRAQNRRAEIVLK